MFKKICKILILLLLMILSKAIFIISVIATENNLHVEIKGLLAFLLVDIFLLNIIHSKKLMFLELMALLFNIICEFSGNYPSILMSNIILVIVGVYILIQTYQYKNKI